MTYSRAYKAHEFTRIIDSRRTLLLAIRSTGRLKRSLTTVLAVGKDSGLLGHYMRYPHSTSTGPRLITREENLSARTRLRRPHKYPR